MFDFNKIDWALLREQKKVLISSIEFFENMQDSVYYKTHAQSLDGILNLLDYLQDSAVATGLSEEVVFGKDKV